MTERIMRADMKKMFRVKTMFGAYDVYFVISKYFSNDNLSLDLFSIEDGPIARLTVNLGDKLEKNMAYLDTNNCGWARKFVEEYGLGRDTGIVKSSGWCTYPLYEFDMNKIRGDA